MLEYLNFFVICARFGSFLAPISVGIITSRHYLSECNKNGEETSEMGDNKNGGDEKTAK